MRVWRRGGEWYEYEVDVVLAAREGNLDSDQKLEPSSTEYLKADIIHSVLHASNLSTTNTRNSLD